MARSFGYTVCSRYDSVWHADERRGRAVAAPPRHRLGALAEAVYTRAGDPGAQFTLEVRRSNDRRDQALRARRLSHLPACAGGYYQDNGEDALNFMWRTPATLEGRLDGTVPAPPTRSPTTP